MSLTRTLILILLALPSTTGCRAYKLKPPAGFAEVHAGDYGTHMKGNDDVGLKVSVFDNVKGGTLAFWSTDLVDKLGARGYTLTGQAPAKSKNGVIGTRFDFQYVRPGAKSDTEARFYSAVLFVTDKHRIVVQLAGKADHYDRYAARVDEIAKATKTRGCRAWTDICDGPQPELPAAPVEPDTALANK